jgi:hypothetical protein
MPDLLIFLGSGLATCGNSAINIAKALQASAGFNPQAFIANPHSINVLPLPRLGQELKSRSAERHALFRKE